ncbi:MAG TPA: hypothetical protein VGC79_10165 [Polyangiaceae bacterium]
MIARAPMGTNPRKLGRLLADEYQAGYLAGGRDANDPVSRRITALAHTLVGFVLGAILMGVTWWLFA